MSSHTYKLIPRANVYVLAAALLSLFVLNEGRAQANVLVQLSPSFSPPQPVGTTITWTASASDTNSGTLEYQFSVQSPGGGFAVVRDFSTSDSFEWTPSEHEGDYNIRVKVRNDDTLELAQLSASYSVSSRATRRDPGTREL